MGLAMVTLTESGVVLAAYFLGCFTTGYYWVRWRAGTDIRLHGSANLGARNVGRLLGPSGFAVTLLGDFAKGALAVWMSVRLGLRQEAVVVVLLAVVVGHNWPIQLRFRGGKGVATSVGALLLFSWQLAMLLAVLFLAGLALLRSFTRGGLLAFAMLPAAAVLSGRSSIEVVAAASLAVLVLVTHRGNALGRLAGIFTRSTRRGRGVRR